MNSGHNSADTYQVDLCWEMETPVGKYLTIADAKWRVDHKVDRDDVLLLEQFRIGAGAHKAMLISNAEFTDGVRRTAERLGIAVHQLCPRRGVGALPATDRGAIQARLRAAAARGRIYDHAIIWKGFALPRLRPASRAGEAGRPSPPGVHPEGAHPEGRVVPHRSPGAAVPHPSRRARPGGPFVAPLRTAILGRPHRGGRRGG